jgi:hypothetical protein
VSGDEIGHRWRLAAIWNVRKLDPRHHLKQLAAEMAGRADAAGTHVDLAWVGLGERDELRRGLRRHRRMNHHQTRRGHRIHDRDEVVHEDVVQVLIERIVDGVDRVRHEQRVTVGRRMRRHLGADIVAAARPVLDKERLAELVAEILRHQPPDDVGGATGRSCDQDADWPRGIGVRECEP